MSFFGAEFSNEFEKRRGQHMKRPKIIDRLALAVGFVPVDEAMDKMQHLLESVGQAEAFIADLMRQVKEYRKLDEEKDKMMRTLSEELSIARNELSHKQHFDWVGR